MALTDRMVCRVHKVSREKLVHKVRLAQQVPKAKREIKAMTAR
jgi:hypothetical protein